MSLNENSEWEDLMLLRISKINNYYVIKNKQNEFFLATAMNPWYGFYNVLLPINKRLVMKLDKKQLNDLTLKSINDEPITGYWVFILLSIVYVFLDIVVEALFLPNIAIYLYILLGITLALQFRRISLAKDAKKSEVIRNFKETHRLKIKAKVAKIFWVSIIFCLIGIIWLLNIELPLISPIIAYITLMSYGALGKMPIKTVIKSSNPYSIYRWSEWGEEEIIEVEDPAQMMKPEKLNK